MNFRELRWVVQSRPSDPIGPDEYFDCAIAIGIGHDLDGSWPSPAGQLIVQKCLDLARRNVVGHIVFCGGNRAKITTEAEAMEYYFIHQWLENRYDRNDLRARLIVENDSHTTYQNALFASEEMRARDFKRAIVVSEGEHHQRVPGIFKKVFSRRGLECKCIKTAKSFGGRWGSINSPVEFTAYNRLAILREIWYGHV